MPITPTADQTRRRTLAFMGPPGVPASILTPSHNDYGKSRMRLLRLISWPYLRKHAVRSILTVLGIVLGVAVFVAMHTANQAVFFAFERTVDKIAGAAQLQVSTGEAGFPEDVLERVQAVPEVEVAVPVIEAAAATRVASQGN